MRGLILVPIDGSSLSETALPVAIAIARRHGGLGVEVVTVAPTGIDPLRASGAPTPDPQLDRDLQSEARDYVARLAERLATMAPELSTRATLLDGPVAESIAAYAKERTHGLIVMTTHGRSGLSRFWLGSVADRLLRTAHVPILLLKDVSSATPAEGMEQFPDVIVPIDAEWGSEAVLDDAVALAGKGASYHLLHVVVPQRHLPPPALDLLRAVDAPPGTPAELLGLTRTSASERIEELARRLTARGLQVTTGVRVHSHPAEAILEYAAERHAHLISMASHGRGQAGRMVMGSVADKVVRGSTVPVLVRVPIAWD